MEFQRLKEATIQKANITCTEGYFRFANHVDKLATTGYKFGNTLWAQREDFKFDERTVQVMKKRYAEIYGKNLLPMYQVIKRDVSNNSIVALVAKPHRNENVAGSIAANCNQWADAGFIYEVLPVTSVEAIELEQKINS